MVFMLGPQTHTAAVIQKQAAFLLLLARQSQALLPPDSLYPLMIEFAAFVAQHARHHPVPNTTIVACFFYDLRTSFILIRQSDWFISPGQSGSLSAPGKPVIL